MTGGARLPAIGWFASGCTLSEPPAYFDICASELPAHQWKIHEELKANSDHVGTKHNTAGWWHFSSTIRIATTAFPPAVSTACLRTCWHISEESVSIKSMISWQNELPMEDPRENWVENVEIRWNQLYLMGSDIFGVGAAGAPGTLVFVFVYLFPSVKLSNYSVGTSTGTHLKTWTPARCAGPTQI